MEREVRPSFLGCLIILTALGWGVFIGVILF
jgi:hypothetical protein